MIGGLLLRVAIGAVIGAVALGSAIITYNIITKENIIPQIIKQFVHKRVEDLTEESKEITEDNIGNPVAAIIMEKQKDSLKMDVFFESLNREGDYEVTSIEIEADEIKDNINEGDVIALVS